eukprot:118142-Alexandrium_andersonii.AAC.1
MSASLVGSEMCIRDRNKSSNNDPNVTGGASAMPRSVPRSEVRDTTCSVSYTHLTLPTICSV